MRGCKGVRFLPLWGAAGLVVLNLVLIVPRGADAGAAAGVVGACCLPGVYDCIDGVSETECMVAFSGIYQGDGTTCGGTDCGACCMPDESCVDYRAPDVCATMGGVLEPETQCVDAGCEIGACCMGDSSCQELRESDCTEAGGQWKGADSICGDFDQDGTDDACESCRSDTNGDGNVDVLDFLNLLADWGPCP
ncbi:MAG: hypothetical protein ACYTE6_01280 [Planctomycetota bacterium]|jgi:hypothetical protein